MKKYALVFTVAYLLLTVAFAVIASTFKFGGGMSFNVTMSIVASFIAAWRFTKEQGRLPTTEENKSYSWMALAGLWMASLLLVAAAFAFLLPPAETKMIAKILESKIVVMAGTAIAIIISALYYFTIRWSFSWYAKRVYNANPQ
jgi:hypothetical protein